jgi:hypothetical protein
MASISKQYVFCLPSTNESVKDKFRNCIQARRAWRWATFIMHELCEVRTGEKIPPKYGKKMKIWHLLGGISLWTIWIERNYNNVQS